MKTTKTKHISTRFQPYQMRHTVTFNQLQEVENKYTGMTEEQAVPLFTKHFAKINTTISQKYSALGTDYEHAIQIAVKHDKRLNQYLTATIAGQDYRIIDYSPDDENYLSYDLLTLNVAKNLGANS